MDASRGGERRLRWALNGGGSWIGARHLDALRRCPGVDIVASCDLDLDRLDLLPDGAMRFTDWRELIYMPDGTHFNGADHVVTKDLDPRAGDLLAGERFPVLGEAEEAVPTT